MINGNKSVMKYFIFGSATTIALAILFSFTFMKEIVQVDNTQIFPQNYKVLVPFIPSELEFAGERVPLENFDVKESIERERP